MGERSVRNAEVRGSIPLISTIEIIEDSVCDGVLFYLVMSKKMAGRYR